MADKTMQLWDKASKTYIPVGYKDLGDGTYALVVSLSGTSASPSSAPAVLTMADGADATQGAKTDEPATSDTGAFSIVALLKRCLQRLASVVASLPTLGQKTAAASFPVVLASDAVPTVALAVPTVQGGRQVKTFVGLSTTAKQVKAGPGVITGFVLSNDNTLGPLYVKFWNKASAPDPTKDAPLFTVRIPANDTVPLSDIGGPVYFDTGLYVTATRLAAPTDTTAPGNAATDVIANIFFA